MFLLYHCLGKTLPVLVFHTLGTVLPLPYREPYLVSSMGGPTDSWYHLCLPCAVINSRWSLYIRYCVPFRISNLIRCSSSRNCSGVRYPRLTAPRCDRFHTVPSMSFLRGLQLISIDPILISFSLVGLSQTGDQFSSR